MLCVFKLFCFDFSLFKSVIMVANYRSVNCYKRKCIIEVYNIFVMHLHSR